MKLSSNNIPKLSSQHIEKTDNKKVKYPLLLHPLSAFWQFSYYAE
jgi:hypothetical protein